MPIISNEMYRRYFFKIAMGDPGDPRTKVQLEDEQQKKITLILPYRVAERFKEKDEVFIQVES